MKPFNVSIERVNPMLSNQQIFDISTTHLFAQNGERSMNGPQCAYRSSSKSMACTRCVLGLFIRDENYTRSIEGDTLGTNMNIRVHISKLVHPDSYGLLVELQRCHDHDLPNDDKANMLIKIAGNHGLNSDLINLLFNGVVPTTPLDSQTVFDATVVWMWAQGDKNCGNGDACLYRKEDSIFARTRCVAGLLIPDSKYHAGMEGESCVAMPELLSLVSDIELLASMQTCHDTPEERVDYIKYSIREYGLNPDSANLLFNLGV